MSVPETRLAGQPEGAHASVSADERAPSRVGESTHSHADEPLSLADQSTHSHADQSTHSHAGQSLSRRRRTRVLIEGDAGLARELCAQIEALAPIERLDGPREILLMNKVRESAQNSLFYLGEALLTECKVRLGQSIGIGLILGRKAERAYELAVIDAAFGARTVPAIAAQMPGWCAALEQEEERLSVHERAARDRLEATRVSFADMLTEEDRAGGGAMSR
ncbi:MAG: phosphonate C-P lyase system protein PhnG [Coriobacteriales bacterium]|jgi:alpha-D-ribose 1-methylphosphonate 5-triphosphate synthase subunit PhnG|nr:phosphonate C-P lyase system protein PhnG [Coriobacteriales bacterium]